MFLVKKASYMAKCDVGLDPISNATLYIYVGIVKRVTKIVYFTWQTSP